MPDKICVILGAGASHDVRNAGSLASGITGSGVVGDSHLRPPLARDLFNIEGNPHYWPYLQEYNGATVLTQGLAEQSKQAGFNLEGELRRLAEHPSAVVRNHFRTVPPYIRDLITACTDNYTPVPSCYVSLAQVLLAEAPSEVLFLVLNYDDLLEQALRLFDPSFTFEVLEDYVRSERQAKVVKLHGSISWFKLIGPRSGDWNQQILEQDVLAKTPDPEVVVSGRRQKTHAIELRESHVYPVLTAPLAGKGITDMVCPSDHLETAREFLVDCRKFMIVGSSGVDEDLLDLLQSTVKGHSDLTAQFVCGDERASQSSWEAFRRGLGVFNALVTPRDEIAYNGGFVTYTSSGAALRFAMM